jgi:hypothetical protein
VVWKWTDSPTMDCPDVCLKALWLQEWQWVLEDRHKRSCWKNSIGVGVPRPYRLDVYVCSKNCWLCLTVVYWLLECNKVPSWIENTEYVTIYWKLCNMLPLECAVGKETDTWSLQSTDDDLIPARNVSLAAMLGSTSGSNVRYYSTWKH